MIGNVIQSKFLELIDYPPAAALSFILMAAILVIAARLRARRRHGEADRMTTAVETLASRAAPERRRARVGVRARGTR